MIQFTESPNLLSLDCSIQAHDDLCTLESGVQSHWAHARPVGDLGGRRGGPAVALQKTSMEAK